MTALPELNNCFLSVKKQLEKESWFKKSRWLADIHPFPEKNPDGVTLHVYKKHWFNEDRQGIHVESFLDKSEAKRRKTYVTLHLLHTPLIPGTQVKRISLSKPFVDGIYKEVSGWPGYKFRAGKYGQQPFTKFLDATAKDFPQALTREITAICTKLGPALDEALAAVCPQPR